jgi:hypothetical protein
MNVEFEQLLKLPYEVLAHALYVKGELEGYSKVTDKTKWRENVTAEKLGHIVHKKISAGAGKDEYGSDAFDSSNQIYAEYKSQAIDDSEKRNLLREVRYPKKGTLYAPLKVKGVYNGAYTHAAIDSYSKCDHYFSVFYKERCALIIKVDTDEVISQLRDTLNKRLSSSKNKTTNCNSVTISLGDTSKYTVAYKDFSIFGGDK